MDFFDVVFPLNIGPLTYRWPSDRGPISAGMLVKAQVKKSLQHGIVLRKATLLHTGKTKEILEVVMDKPIISGPLLKLLKWTADYYMVNEGLALKTMFTKDVFEETSRRVRKSTGYCGTGFIQGLTESSIVSAVRESASRKEYKTYLFHAPSFQDEISYLFEIIKGINNVIILVPETAFIEKISPAVGKLAGERLTVLHGRLTKAQRRYAFQRIISGDSDVVLGTRPAVFAPLKSLSLIAVLQEHNVSYKNLEGVGYHGRDVAVMRAYLEKSAALLSSPSPAIESFYNTTSGKYTLLKTDIRPRRPRIEVINMRFAKKVTSHLSRKAVDALSARIKRKEKGLLLINRKGYSIIQCADCNFIEACPECGIPLVYHKDKKLLRCHYCSRALVPSDACRRCKGSHLEMIGAGTQRIAAEIEKNLGVKPVVMDKDVFRENVKLKCSNDITSGEEMIVGTKFAISRLPHVGSLDLCVFLNPDTNLHLPDFRAPEFLFQQISGISEHVKPDGLLLLQTRIPENAVFKYIRNYNFEDFFKEELVLRRSLSYPPLSKMILVSVSSTANIEEKLSKIVSLGKEGIDVIGPYRTIRGGTGVWKLLLKSPFREKLHDYARSIIEELEKEKGMRIKADVDPISI